MTTAQQFWNRAFNERYDPPTVDLSYGCQGDCTRNAFLELIGDVRGLRVLEVGCGTGELSVYLAKIGACVTATDFSESAVRKARSAARFNGVSDRMKVHQINALNLQDLGDTYDLVVGRYVLHHIEPFNIFVRALQAVMKDQGRGIFIENNASNPILMFARKYIAGRFGIPRYGDDEEYPLEPREIALLERKFDRVTQHFPDFIFFRILSIYVFRYHPRFAWLLKLNMWMDRGIYRFLPWLRRYSYQQVVEVNKGAKSASTPSDGG